ncbi:MAG: hypothetical protein DLM72_08320 [Candidatus Nitrosopolaris wilkensis]|nr:MAG: hypothetical protein DLM72_08320 [Candidatus Nitrosopolaris wilkensis]
MVYLCLKDNTYTNSQFVIIVGPNQELAISLIRRLKRLFEPDVYFNDKEVICLLNGVRIEAFPSNHLNAARALENPKFILADEADFFGKSEQLEVRKIVERYLAKSDPYIALISTPGNPDGLFSQIEKEPTCIYKRIMLPWQVGLGKIYTQDEIDLAMKSNSFESEYCLKYGGHQGNTFSPAHIDKCKSISYNPDAINYQAAISMGLDPAWGSSNFGIVITQLSDMHIQVLYAQEFERSDYNQMLNKVWDLNLKYQPTKIYIDASSPEFIRSIKDQIGEDSNYEEAIARYKLMKVDFTNNMKVIPVNFRESKAMLDHMKYLLESGMLAIDPRFDKLLISLYSAWDVEGKLDKGVTAHNDIFDAYMIALLEFEV